MEQIRPFLNIDLPEIADVWIRHWSTVTTSPAVSVAMIEQAIFSRTFFRASDLLVARRDDVVVGWCHTVPGASAEAACLAAICFSPAGLALCDKLLLEAELRWVAAGYRCVDVGPLRDACCGYAGLAPVGHGIGVPTADARTSSLLSRRGYSSGLSVERLVVATSQYRPQVNRDWMQLRRSTRIEHRPVVAEDPWTASAMAHLDMEHYRLIDHRNGHELASVNLWVSDPEAQVMSCSEALLDLGGIHDRGGITTEEGFLISMLIQSLAARRIFSLQTAVDSDRTPLIEQLGGLGLAAVERGNRWGKTLVPKAESPAPTMPAARSSSTDPEHP